MPPHCHGSPLSESQKHLPLHFPGAHGFDEPKTVGIQSLRWIGAVQELLIGDKLVVTSWRKPVVHESSTDCRQPQSHLEVGVRPLFGELKFNITILVLCPNYNRFGRARTYDLHCRLFANLNVSLVDPQLRVLLRDVERHHLLKANVRHLRDKQGSVTAVSPRGRNDGRAL